MLILNYYEALQYLQSAIGLDPQNAEVYHQLGQTLLKLGENDRAIEAFQTAVELQPQNQVFQSSLESVK
jgi:Flp pilus assembly protein TadD